MTMMENAYVRTPSHYLRRTVQETCQQKTENKNVLKKTTNNISFAPYVKFVQQTLLRPHMP